MVLDVFIGFVVIVMWVRFGIGLDYDGLIGCNMLYLFVLEMLIGWFLSRLLIWLFIRSLGRSMLL